MADRTPQTSTRTWIAAGVQHEVMLRALPAVRHDLVGPLSVTRMGTAVLKRHLAKEPVDGAGAIQRVEQIDSQLETLVSGVRALRHWDLHHGDSASAYEALHIVLELARPALALRGVALETADGWEARASHGSLSLGALLYLGLAAIFHLQDDDARRPASVAVDVRPDGSVSVTAQGRAGADDALLPPAADGQESGMLAIGADALDCLAERFGWRIDLTPAAVTLFPADR